MSEITKIPPPLYPPESKGENDLRLKQRRNCELVAGLLDEDTDTFRWDTTAEGYDFWHGVYRRLLAISKGEALK